MDWQDFSIVGPIEGLVGRLETALPTLAAAAPATVTCVDEEAWAVHAGDFTEEATAAPPSSAAAATPPWLSSLWAGRDVCPSRQSLLALLFSTPRFVLLSPPRSIFGFEALSSVSRSDARAVLGAYNVASQHLAEAPASPGCSPRAVAFTLPGVQGAPTSAPLTGQVELPPVADLGFVQVWAPSRCAYIGHGFGCLALQDSSSSSSSGGEGTRWGFTSRAKCDTVTDSSHTELPHRSHPKKLAALFASKLTAVAPAPGALVADDPSSQGGAWSLRGGMASLPTLLDSYGIGAVVGETWSWSPRPLPPAPITATPAPDRRIFWGVPLAGAGGVDPAVALLPPPRACRSIAAVCLSSLHGSGTSGRRALERWDASRCSQALGDGSAVSVRVFWRTDTSGRRRPALWAEGGGNSDSSAPEQQRPVVTPLQASSFLPTAPWAAGAAALLDASGQSPFLPAASERPCGMCLPSRSATKRNPACVVHAAAGAPVAAFEVGARVGRRLTMLEEILAGHVASAVSAAAASRQAAAAPGAPAAPPAKKGGLTGRARRLIRRVAETGTGALATAAVALAVGAVEATEALAARRTTGAGSGGFPAFPAPNVASVVAPAAEGDAPRSPSPSPRSQRKRPAAGAEGEDSVGVGEGEDVEEAPATPTGSNSSTRPVSPPPPPPLFTEAGAGLLPDWVVPPERFLSLDLIATVTGRVFGTDSTAACALVPPVSSLAASLATLLVDFLATAPLYPAHEEAAEAEGEEGDEGGLASWPSTACLRHGPFHLPFSVPPGVNAPPLEPVAGRLTFLLSNEPLSGYVAPVPSGISTAPQLSNSVPNHAASVTGTDGPLSPTPYPGGGGGGFTAGTATIVAPSGFSSTSAASNHRNGPSLASARATRADFTPSTPSCWSPGNAAAACAATTVAACWWDYLQRLRTAWDDLTTAYMASPAAVAASRGAPTWAFREAAVPRGAPLSVQRVAILQACVAALQDAMAGGRGGRARGRLGSDEEGEGFEDARSDEEEREEEAGEAESGTPATLQVTSEAVKSGCVLWGAAAAAALTAQGACPLPWFLRPCPAAAQAAPGATTTGTAAARRFPPQLLALAPVAADAHLLSQAAARRAGGDALVALGPQDCPPRPGRGDALSPDAVRADMGAFVTANPSATLVDFWAWYVPCLLEIEEESAGLEEGGSTTTRLCLRLSPLLSGNQGEEDTDAVLIFKDGLLASVAVPSSHSPPEPTPPRRAFWEGLWGSARPWPSAPGAAIPALFSPFVAAEQVLTALSEATLTDVCFDMYCCYAATAATALQARTTRLAGSSSSAGCAWLQAGLARLATQEVQQLSQDATAFVASSHVFGGGRPLDASGVVEARTGNRDALVAGAEAVLAGLADGETWTLRWEALRSLAAAGDARALSPSSSAAGSALTSACKGLEERVLGLGATCQADSNGGGARVPPVSHPAWTSSSGAVTFPTLLSKEYGSLVGRGGEGGEEGGSRTGAGAGAGGDQGLPVREVSKLVALDAVSPSPRVSEGASCRLAAQAWLAGLAAEEASSASSVSAAAPGVPFVGSSGPAATSPRSWTSQDDDLESEDGAAPVADPLAPLPDARATLLHSAWGWHRALSHTGHSLGQLTAALPLPAQSRLMVLADRTGVAIGQVLVEPGRTPVKGGGATPASPPAAPLAAECPT